MRVRAQSPAERLTAPEDDPPARQQTRSLSRIDPLVAHTATVRPFRHRPRDPAPAARRGGAASEDDGLVGGRSAADEDARLVARVRARERGAEEAIYRRHVGYVAGMVLRLMADPAETEDVVQDTFALALEQLPRLRDGSALRPWLAQIAVSQMNRRFRRRRLMRLLGLQGEEVVAFDAIASRDASPDVVSELAALGRAVGALPPDQRVAWSLRHIEGATLPEVAAACDCSLATAKRRIAAADDSIRAVVRLADAVVLLPERPDGPHPQEEP
jgi:RNA polymerase sigma-70 factor (ECF subfamily)